MQRSTLLLIASTAMILTAFVWLTTPDNDKLREYGNGGNSIMVPRLSQLAEQGQVLFNANCAACHGRNGAGTQQGPPLVHKIYEPSHHSDLSFQRAAKFGVRAHHWPFGDMPPVPDVTESHMVRIIAYVRELQRANEIQ